MRNTYILVLLCVILSINTRMNAQEATYKILYDVRSIKLGTISSNGEWIGYGYQGNAYYYNTVTEKSKTMVDSEHPGMSVQAISNSGMLLGGYGYNASSPAAYYKNNKWTVLPVPEGREKQAGMVSAISEDETIMSGFVDGNRAAKQREQLLPSIWKLTDGKYLFEALPLPLKDITGGIAQGAAVRDMSADGSVLVGDFWSADGFKKLPIIWERGEKGEYTYKIWGEELSYNLDAENPGSFPLYEEWVTAPGGTPEYDEQYSYFQQLCSEYGKKRAAFYAGKGNFELRNISVSRNGRWLVTAWEERDSNKGLQAYRIDLQNETATIYSGDYNTCPRAVLDDGTVIAFSPFNGYIWTGFVYKEENNTQKPLYEWIKEEKGVDISEDFLFNIPVEDPNTGIINDVDSIVTGCCTISKDGSTVLSYLADPDSPSRIINYYVRKESANNISDISSQSITVYVNNNILYTKGDTKELSLFDLTGKEIYRTQDVKDSMPLNYLQKGIYLVKIVSLSGETFTNKILIE